MPGSANHVSLEQGQLNFAALGVAERRNQGAGREPFAEEPRDVSWRPLDPGRDNVEEPVHGVDYADSYPLSDTTVLYYWRKSYWRKLSS